MVCAQPLLIHIDGTGSCSVPGCLDHDSLTEAVRRHRSVVNCQAVLGAQCAVCHRPDGPDGRPTRRSVDTGGYESAPICVGVAIVHADLSLECSVPGCAADPSRAAWLARHADVRSCSDLVAVCVLCSTAEGE